MTNGVKTTNLTRQFAIDEVIGNVTTEGVASTVRIPFSALADQLAGTGTFVLGNVVFAATEPDLDASVPPSETAGGAVLADPDPTRNGYYSQDGAGGWDWQRGFPDTLASVTLSGTATAQTGVVDAGVNPAGVVEFRATVTTENTGPLTLSIGGEEPRPVVNLAGNALSAGEWTGVVKFFIDDLGNYKLANDPGSAAAAAQSATDAAASLAEFNEKYLGAYADDASATAAAGGSPITGALYWNTTDGQLKTWDGAAWQVSSASIPDGAITDVKVATPATPADGIASSKIAYLGAATGAAARSLRDKLDELGPSPYDFDATGDGVADDTAAMAAWAASGPNLTLPDGTFTTTDTVTFPSDVKITVIGRPTIMNTAATTLTSLLHFDGYLTWEGDTAIVDADSSAYLGMFAPIYLPKIDNIIVRNTLSVAYYFGREFGGASATDFGAGQGVGHGYARFCKTEACGGGFFPTGTNVPDKDTSFGLIECQTDEATGFETQITAFDSLGYSYAHGGWFRGVSTAAPNMTRCDRCEYIGGVYEGIARGPTVGQFSDNITIVGGRSINTVHSGVSVDSRLAADNTVPYVNYKVDWTIVGEPDHGVFLQASGGYVTAHQIMDGLADGTHSVVRLSDALDVRIGDVTCENGGTSSLITVGESVAPVPGSSVIKCGNWKTDSTATVAILISGTGSKVLWAGVPNDGVSAISADYDLKLTDDIIFVNAGSAQIDLDVPTSSQQDHIGKKWEVIVVDSTNNVTVTRHGGGGTFNGVANQFIFSAGASNRKFTIYCRGAGLYYCV